MNEEEAIAQLIHTDLLNLIEARKNVAVKEARKIMRCESCKYLETYPDDDERYECDKLRTYLDADYCVKPFIPSSEISKFGCIYWEKKEETK